MINKFDNYYLKRRKLQYSSKTSRNKWGSMLHHWNVYIYHYSSV